MRTKTAIICFFQVKNSYHGAAEVSLGLFNSWPSKEKKLFELNDWHLLVSKNKRDSFKIRQKKDACVCPPMETELKQWIINKRDTGVCTVNFHFFRPSPK